MIIRKKLQPNLSQKTRAKFIHLNVRVQVALNATILGHLQEMM